MAENKKSGWIEQAKAWIMASPLRRVVKVITDILDSIVPSRRQKRDLRNESQEREYINEHNEKMVTLKDSSEKNSDGLKDPVEQVAAEMPDYPPRRVLSEDEKRDEARLQGELRWIDNNRSRVENDDRNYVMTDEIDLQKTELKALVLREQLRALHGGAKITPEDARKKVWDALNKLGKYELSNIKDGKLSLLLTAAKTKYRLPYMGQESSYSAIAPSAPNKKDTAQSSVNGLKTAAAHVRKRGINPSKTTPKPPRP